MSTHFNELSESVRWRLMVEAAKTAAGQQGYKLSRVPGRGLSNVWNIEKDGKKQVASIRTSRDRWFAFPPLDGGTRWKTLDGADVVLVAVTDSKDDPKSVQVFLFPAAEVRKRFNEAYAARIKDGHKIPDNFGMWVCLDEDPRGIASSVGAGIATQYPPIAVFMIQKLIEEIGGVAISAPVADEVIDDDAAPSMAVPSTIAEVMDWSRVQIASLAGVRVDAVKLDLRIEY
ncbi:hypothetical protein [Nevskia ramosa]|uniref:hypothetical protein n=1 Tax=Nevskia ramosa TaxID=64002 RepID=UPI0003B6BA99|nr:hypothetical protein [Nevskia ramosa]